MRALHLNADADFRILLEALQSEIGAAADSFKLHQDLLRATRTHSTEMAQSWTFWSLAIRALGDSAIVRLCRVYDHQKDALSLGRFLRLVEARPDLFDSDKFRERLKGNPYVESLAARPRRPDPKQVARDLRFVHAKTNAVVRRLVAARDKIYGHRDPDVVTGQQPIPLLLARDIKTLLARGRRILNRYSELSMASVFAERMVGHDDYKAVFRAVREAVRRHDKEIARQARLVGVKWSRRGSKVTVTPLKKT